MLLILLSNKKSINIVVSSYQNLLDELNWIFDLTLERLSYRPLPNQTFHTFEIPKITKYFKKIPQELLLALYKLLSVYWKIVIYFSFLKLKWVKYLRKYITLFGAHVRQKFTFAEMIYLL
jgi:hypothetical protein